MLDLLNAILFVFIVSAIFYNHTAAAPTHNHTTTAPSHNHTHPAVTLERPRKWKPTISSHAIARPLNISSFPCTFNDESGRSTDIDGFIRRIKKEGYLPLNTRGSSASKNMTLSPLDTLRIALVKLICELTSEGKQIGPSEEDFQPLTTYDSRPRLACPAGHFKGVYRPPKSETVEKQEEKEEENDDKKKKKSKNKKEKRKVHPTKKRRKKSNKHNSKVKEHQGKTLQGINVYSKNLHNAILFYEAQRSGPLPANQRIRWRHPSHLDDGAEANLNLTGGYYDAGDYVKFGFPSSFAMTMLSWAAVDYPQGFQRSGEMKYIREAIKWGTDYILKSHIKPGIYVAQVGDPDWDHRYWGSPENEPKTIKRPIYMIDGKRYTGTEVVAEAAAALAAASLVFRKEDPDYSKKLLKHAIQLYELGDHYRGNYNKAIQLQVIKGGGGANAYPSYSGYGDELVWGAIWIYRATKEKQWLEKAEKYYTDFKLENNWNSGEAIFHAQTWDDKSVGATNLLAAYSNQSKYRKYMKNYFRDVLYNPKGFTPGGLYCADLCKEGDGLNGIAMNTAYQAFWYADNVLVSKEIAAANDNDECSHVAFAMGQVNYILGDNPANRVYIVGADHSRSPTHVHHPSSQGVPAKSPDLGTSYISKKLPNKFTLFGALVGGPDGKDHFEDNRESYKMTEPALDINASLVGVLARVVMAS
ncbi:uncharacterized protein VTP21DRAFT_1795 [Calcarisporiella thermophila]|uniref:uncharacterized protein n=1 Tax=Calcarisporiella thermophila TaxID=911321 RepID=UPI003742F2D6